MMSRGMICAPRDGQEGTEDGEHEAARLSGRPLSDVRVKPGERKTSHMGVLGRIATRGYCKDSDPEARLKMPDACGGQREAVRWELGEWDRERGGT